MPRQFRFLFAASMLVAVAALSSCMDQEPQNDLDPRGQQASLTSDLLTDIGQVEKKLIDLANAIPENKFGWRPAAGVRSIGEVVLHVASDNYLIPAALGFAADSSTGIKGDDYNTALAYEKRTMTKAQAVAELEKSFAHVRTSLSGTTQDRFADSANLFGRQVTNQQAWILAATHLHEHLGQLIAYARSNGVVPPWSAAGSQ
jgi:uncharacterized damage-inducible protein DinB